MSLSLSRRRALALGAGLLAIGPVARAAYPDKPLRLLVPFPAGGTVDTVARALGTQLSKELHTAVVVENVPGAGGAIATQRVASAAPDGYTLLFTTPNHTINPALYDKLGFDTERDLRPVSLVAQIPELLVAHASQPYSDFAGFVAYARANPGKLNYASAGNGTLPHVTMELLLQQLHLKVTHVPYKGAAPALNDLLSGVVAVKMDTIATSAAHIHAGRIKPLAIASLKRSPLMPDVPTIAESGLPGYQGILWMGVVAPAAVPPAVVDTLYRAIRASLADPALQKTLDAGGVDAVGSSPAEFGKTISIELRQWAEVVKHANIKAG
ncbi:tripartite tricarboxylate transporter substrate binding protein [Ramlibacter sp. G-1-2-2]|uniref:Tripartite tricarboxylate transporter substrate binding protein n=1 Tax=Ramlibacter agri TaxID=2728837 RepID=A0A848H270_9BURK|nr:tripartite tricarboxylate transporter substrate binding protein [Ramlibacter agri]NML44567.1 tripartite tricarboxylate transporter substrate binding protein [Ramlibacter agri]